MTNNNNNLQKNFNLIILCFFIIISIFPTFRILAIGSESSKDFKELVISLIPEILAFSIITLSAIFLLKNRANLQITNIDLVVIFYLTFNIIYGSILSKSIMLSLYEIRMTFISVLFYFSGRCYFNNGLENAEKLYLKLVYLFLIIGIIGIILYVLFPDFMIKMCEKGGLPDYYVILRMTSIFWTPLIFGFIMSFGGVFIYYRICKKSGFLNYIYISIFWICLIYSVSRSAICIFIIGIIILTMLQSKWKEMMKTGIILVIIYFINIYIIPRGKDLSNFLLFSTAQTIDMEKGVTRVDLWVKSFESFKEKPMGHGLGKAGLVAKRFFKNSNTTDVSIYSTDCFYLKIANETGILGLVSYLTLLIFLFIHYLKYLSKYRKTLFSFLFTLFILAQIDNIFHNYIDFYLITYLYWLTIGISVNFLANDAM